MPEEGKGCTGDVVFGRVPDWMDSGFFEKALRTGLGDPKLRVCRCEVRAATGKGENYVSIVYAATVCTSEEGEEGGGGGGGRRRHLIVKCLPTNKARTIICNKAEFFRKEVDMYEVVFPEFRRLSSGGAGVLPWPLHYSSHFDGARDFLVLEDLRVAGYTMTGRLQGLDTAHLTAALRALAQFHAFSYALKLREPEVFRTKVYDLFPETLFSPKSEDMMSVYIRNTYRDTAAAIRDWGEPRYDRVVQWMDVAKDTAMRDMIQLLSPDDPGSVLNHGDFWINNMLFRSVGGGEGAEEEVKLLDFQIAKVCSPASDLSYLMATSVTTPVRRAHWDTLLKTAYLGPFWEALRALGVQGLTEAGVYTWPWLQSEMLRYRPFAFVTILTTTQVVLAEASDAPDMDSMTEEQLMGQDEQSPFSDLAKGQLYQARLRDLLDDFMEQGLFD